MLKAFDTKILSVHDEYDLSERGDLAGDIFIVGENAYLIEDEGELSYLGRPGSAFLQIVAERIYRLTSSSKSIQDIEQDLESYFGKSEETTR